MIQAEPDKQAGQDQKRDRPGERYFTRTVLQSTSQHDKQALSGNGGDAIESTSYPDVESLVVRVECQHIKAVGRNIMGGRTESHQPEDSKGHLEEMIHRNGKSDTGQSGPYQELHGHHPPAFCFQ